MLMDLCQLMLIGVYVCDVYLQFVIVYGYDQNWVFDQGGQLVFVFVVCVYDLVLGCFFELYMMQLGLQFYMVNGLNGSVVGKGGMIYW